MSSIAVLTSIYGGYDTPAPPAAQDVACDWILVTDQQTDCWPWKTIVEPRPQLHPRLAAKVAKCRPDLYTDADMTVWVDGHVRITDPGFVRWATSPLQADVVLAQIRHPNRQSLLAEAELSARLAKYEGLPVNEQTASYLEDGYPDEWGLWACGVIARRDTPVMRAFGDMWLREQVRWTYQDQLSESPVLHRLGVRPYDLDGPVVGHRLFQLGRHVDGTG